MKNKGSNQIEKVLVFDYVIVGGGAACSVFAARCAKDSDRSVALLERGPRQRFYVGRQIDMTDLIKKFNIKGLPIT